MTKKALITALIATFSVCSFATPGIRYVDYNRDKIPNIITAAGIASEIIFEEDERIEYVTFGFDSAWESKIVKDYILVFKAKDEQPETNLIVHTDKRDYLFIVTSGNNDWEKNPNNAGAYYSVRMRYHDGKSKAALAAEEEKGILRNRDISPISSYLYSNYDYRETKNATDIIPYRVWDNGTITFIAFKAGKKRGVVYELDANNKSHLINQHTEKNGLLVIHGVYEHMIIRLGDQAVELRRNNEHGQKENYSKTTVENTTRVTAGNAPIKFESTNSNNEKNIFNGGYEENTDENEEEFIDLENEEEFIDL